jgi:hypothetical protein
LKIRHTNKRIGLLKEFSCAFISKELQISFITFYFYNFFFFVFTMALIEGAPKKQLQKNHEKQSNSCAVST